MILKTETTRDSVRITLENGVTFDVSCHSNDHIHLHFSGIEGGLIASGFHNHPTVDKLKLANYADISYKAREK